MTDHQLPDGAQAALLQLTTPRERPPADETTIPSPDARDADGEDS